MTINSLYRKNRKQLARLYLYDYTSFAKQLKVRAGIVHSAKLMPADIDRIVEVFGMPPGLKPLV